MQTSRLPRSGTTPRTHAAKPTSNPPRCPTWPPTVRRYDEPMAAQPQITLPLHRLDLETYNRIVASGALQGQHVELLDGLVVEMSPKSPAHVAVVTLLARHFAAAPRWWTQVQDPIEVAPSSEPEPDIAIAAHRPPQGQHMRSPQLVIEVAVSSQAVDRGLKARLYASAGISTYWLIDVPGRCIEVRTQPDDHDYRRCDVYREGSTVPSPLTGVADLDVAGLLTDVTG